MRMVVRMGSMLDSDQRRRHLVRLYNIYKCRASLRKVERSLP